MAFPFAKKASTPEEEAKKLSRTELLEMLIDETKEAERLRQENERLTEELARCKADLERTGSLKVIMRQLGRMAGVPEYMWADPEPAEEPAKKPADQDSLA